MKYFLPAALVLGATALPGSGTAQEPWLLSVEASVGATRGFSDASIRHRGSSNGILADLLVGVRLHSRGHAGVFVALDAAEHAVNTTTTSDCLPTPNDDGCTPWFPGFGAVSLLGGWESRSTQLRVLAGPGVVSSDFDEAAGFAGRVDAALPVFGRISLTATMKTLFIPSWRGDRYSFIAGGLGLRFR